MEKTERNIISIIAWTLLLAGCTTIHEVNIKELDQNKNKTFRIGFVKVVGSHRSSPFSSDHVEKKKEALSKIPVEKIIKVLSDVYGLRIDAETDHAIKTVKETIGSSYTGAQPASSGIFYQIFLSQKSENPYFGNNEYIQPGFLKGLFVEPGMRDEDVGDMVYIAYSFEPASGFPPKVKFYYEVMVKSGSSTLIHHKGIVPVVYSERKGLFNAEAIWNDFVLSAGIIDEALSKDLLAKK